MDEDNLIIVAITLFDATDTQIPGGPVTVVDAFTFFCTRSGVTNDTWKYDLLLLSTTAMSLVATREYFVISPYSVIISHCWL